MFLDVSVYLSSLKQLNDERKKTITKIYSRRYDLFKKTVVPEGWCKLDKYGICTRLYSYNNI